MVIMNGRCGLDNKIGKSTTRDISVIDYVIVTASLLCEINEFKVCDFNGIISDIHCGIDFNISAPIQHKPSDSQPGINEPANLQKRPKRWESNQSTYFCENIEDSMVDTITEK
ncbi:unnamed protein product, partial [Owenia fusiformis]